MSTADMPATVLYRVRGMDCQSCAAKIEKATSSLPRVEAVKVSITSQEMELRVDQAGRRLPAVERTVEDLGYRLSRLDSGAGETAGSSHTSPAYTKALWTVVLLNLGYGIVEIVGGFITGSQALKADALDFIGDGLISWIGLVAIRWGLRARARLRCCKVCSSS
jgi:cation transport ATPase